MAALSRAALRRILALAWFGLMALTLLSLNGCGKRDDAPANGAGSSASDEGVFQVLAGSELKDMEPALVQAAANAGVKVRFSYAGVLDMVERVNAGEQFDAILPANGAYPALALTAKPLSSKKLFYSRVALGVKVPVVKALGWDQQAPSWAEIAKVAGQGRLRYAMTNPTSSNTGMSALFAVASAVAGKTEDLKVSEVQPEVLKAFLAGQKLTAGSSGWLAETFVKDPSGLDAMVNYEAVILRSNEKLPADQRLQLVYPRDGVISADYPLMLMNEARRLDYDKLAEAWRAPKVQASLSQQAFVRPAVQSVPIAPGLSAAPVAELAFPGRLEVIDAVLAAYQGEWRRPATSIFVLDTSGSMQGQRLLDMQAALKVLAGADAATASSRYARFQNRERVLLISFSSEVAEPLSLDFEGAGLQAARQRVMSYADSLGAEGNTNIFGALLAAQALAAQERARDPQRLVSIVLLTDGEKTRGPDLAEFEAQVPRQSGARIFPILFGEANPQDMEAVAQWTGGRVFDGRKAALAQVFKEIRGYQ